MLFLIHSTKSTGRCLRKFFGTREALERHIERTIARGGKSRTARRFRFEVYAAGGAR
ncbi:MAG: hypothetical protein U0797_00550 [Gemmataceae bacterium]